MRACFWMGHLDGVGFRCCCYCWPIVFALVTRKANVVVVVLNLLVVVALLSSALPTPLFIENACLAGVGKGAPGRIVQPCT